MTDVNLDRIKLIRYLEIAKSQRIRGANQLQNNYGVDSAAVKEAQTEIAELNSAINQLHTANLTKKT